ncbi:uncharacterized protein M421DRAFT_153666 [Didymella exigua CBS 183.55]|uniref:Uncharacterized protein n=1 Tax=Didymella exigua CBS 183.55 TaxID=1150837 RepID=A0A6A5RLS0_9PLEO|nr:uncharacterized protein M421DRAFT_153666 [Didymella exigua CBS 183.55]KAF1928732.1 hypothetical protein M421DRAFT_153666 [Didymella exigua CBS 183.55]
MPHLHCTRVTILLCLKPSSSPRPFPVTLLILPCLALAHRQRNMPHFALAARSTLKILTLMSNQAASSRACSIGSPNSRGFSGGQGEEDHEGTQVLQGGTVDEEVCRHSRTYLPAHLPALRLVDSCQHGSNPSLTPKGGRRLNEWIG